jgi:hypothetical protein
VGVRFVGKDDVARVGAVRARLADPVKVVDLVQQDLQGAGRVRLSVITLASNLADLVH